MANFSWTMMTSSAQAAEACGDRRLGHACLMEEVLGQVLSSLALIAAAGIGAYKFGGKRSTILGLLDIHDRLPDGETRAHLLAHILQRVEGLVTHEDEHRRDPAGIAIGLVFVAIGVWMGYVALSRDSWQWIFGASAVAALMLGLVGTMMSIEKRKRDAKGNAIE